VAGWLALLLHPASTEQQQQQQQQQDGGRGARGHVERV